MTCYECNDSVTIEIAPIIHNLSVRTKYKHEYINISS